jgi:predicted outer membrane protein
MHHTFRHLTAATLATLGLIAAATSATAQAAHVSAWDQQWLKTSIEGDRFEIAGGMLAQQKGASATVRALGARLVTDHTKSLKDASKVARRLGISVPGKPTPSMQWELQIVGTLSGSQFDHWYSDLEVEDHKQDITESKDEIKEGSNPQVKKLAAEDLPVLKEHLALSIHALGVSP